MRHLAVEVPFQIMTERPTISVIVPAFNEAPRIRASIARLKEAIESNWASYEIIVSEDGSTDGTDKIAAYIAMNDPKVIHLHSDERLGVGGGIKRGLEAARGRIVVYMDADLAVDLKHLPQLVKTTEKTGGMTIGSRNLMTSDTTSTPLRRTLSLTFNAIARTLFQDGIHDHHCGFKALPHRVVQEVLPEIEENGFLFDTELIVRIFRKGYSVVEMPVRWIEPKPKGAFTLDKIVEYHKLLRLWLRLTRLETKAGKV